MIVFALYFANVSPGAYMGNVVLGDIDENYPENSKGKHPGAIW